MHPFKDQFLTDKHHTKRANCKNLLRMQQIHRSGTKSRHRRVHQPSGAQILVRRHQTVNIFSYIWTVHSDVVYHLLQIINSFTSRVFFYYAGFPSTHNVLLFVLFVLQVD